jgi:hypothetical protein
MEGDGLLTASGGNYRLSEKGQKFLIELIAVAQASQERLASRLAPSELAMLRHLLERAIQVSNADQQTR